MITKLDINMMALAVEASKLSMDLTSKVGCVIRFTHEDQPVVTMGWNKPLVVQGITTPSTAEMAQHPVLKKYFMKHAEIDALDQVHSYFRKRIRPSAEGSTMYVTKAICYDCATTDHTYASFVNIKRIVMAKPYKRNVRTGNASKWYDEQMMAVQDLTERGVTVHFMDVATDQNGNPYLPKHVIDILNQE